ncbi:hypothetical protein J3A78_001453 [Streptomyces sp. PvR006]|uniref:hypothetical protein n=1 Tax=Streptomyces sp. PvR006 TaxID=2817860 RepID=UPI001AE84484|nr:hypothetical protein [Streptomyces sp. PvR006]MBP2580975.1 hypothetical protein [Streptomyces sp. PvR006]
MFRLMRILVLLVATFCCTATLAAAAPPPPPVPWMNALGEALDQGKRMTQTFRPGNLTAMDAQKTRLRELLRTVPTNPPDEVLLALARGRALVNQMDAITEGSALGDEAAEVASASFVPPRDLDGDTRRLLLADMKKAAAGAINDVACGEVWSLLTNEQKARLDEPVDSHNHLNSLVEAIDAQYRSVLAKNWNVGYLNRVIGWGTFVQGVSDKTVELVGFMEGGHVTPVDTRAFYYYFHFCMKPPG